MSTPAVRRRVIASGLALTGALALTGSSCSRSVDAQTSGATPVPGTSVLHRFCDQSMLVYVSIVTAEADNFEAFFFGGCAFDEATQRWLPAIGRDAPARTAPTAPETDESNQQDERDEGN